MNDSNAQYPPQDGVYKVKVKNGRGWHDYDTARFHISVGQSYHEGHKMLATLQWAKHRFKRVIICVNDTLQRHNGIYEGQQSQQAWDKSLKAGDEWLANHQWMIDQLPNVEVHRWSEWLNHPDYQEQQEQIHALYRQDETFQQMIVDNVHEFWTRRNKKHGVVESHRFGAFQKTSTDYLLEETAAFFLMFKRDRAVDVYPGSVLIPCVLAEKYLEGHKGLGQRAFTRIDFSKNTSHENIPMVANG